MASAIEIESTERVGNLAIEVTWHPDKRTRAVQVTRHTRAGRVHAMTFFADELDDLIEAMNDAADIVQGVATDSNSNSAAHPARDFAPNVGRPGPQTRANAAADRGR